MMSRRFQTFLQWMALVGMMCLTRTSSWSRMGEALRPPTASRYLSKPRIGLSQRPARLTWTSMRTETGEEEGAPIFSVPIPGSQTATLQIPSLPSLQRLSLDIVHEVQSVGIVSGGRRTLQAQRALLEVGVDLLQTRELPLDVARAARTLRFLFERLGATYIKIGQFIASSPTLFPAAFVTEFEACLDSSPPVPFNVIRDIIERELGGKLEELFDDVDPSPLATASIAQVHAATLKGEKVVIKVLKPGVEDTLRTDLTFLNIVTRISEAVAPELARLSLAGIATDLRQSMLGELDFTKEAERVTTFGAFLDEKGLNEKATSPRVIGDRTSRGVLTMTRIDGVPLIDVEQLETDTRIDAEAAVAAALDTWALSVLECEFFHADVHGGNLLIQPDGKIAFIDFGIVGKLPEKTWGAVSVMQEAFNVGDADKLASSLMALGVADETVIDKQVFADDLRSMFSSLERVQGAEGLEQTASDSNTQGTGSIGEAGSSVAQLAFDVVTVSERNGLVLPRDFGLLVKQGLYFDRYLKALAPNLDPFTDSRVSSMSGSVTSTDTQADSLNGLQVVPSA